MRLVTRSDFDGLACGAMLMELGVVDEMKFTHPKDLQDGLIEVTENDVLANVPYVKGCGLWFDHHSSEEERQAYGEFEGASRPAPSAARVVYEYYGGKEKLGKFVGLVAGVDQCDSAQFHLEDIRKPHGWVLLSFVMDPRTGLGRYHDYRISNYQLMEQMPEFMRTMSPEEILAHPDVKERVNRYFAQQREFDDMLKEKSRQDGNVVVTDLRGMEEIKSGNRFTIYALYPETNVSIRVMDGKGKQNAVFSVGHSVLNRTSKTDVGSQMLRYGGGGHRQVGTCQVPYDDADRVLKELVEQMKADG